MASRSLGRLTIDLIAKVAGFTEGLTKAEREADKRGKAIERSLKRASTAVKAFVSALAVGAVFRKVIEETRQFQDEQAQLTAVLESTAQAAGFNRDQMNQMAAQIERVTTFSAGEINQAQTALLAFTGIVGDQFPRAMQAAIDMAARMGTSVSSAAETIGRALDVPSKGLAALSRQGFRFTEEQKALAVFLESTGRTAEAQGLILDALQESYGGAAKAARDTFGGALIALKNTTDSLLTDERGLVAANESIEDLIETLSDPRVKEAFGVMVAGLVDVATAAARALPAITSFAKFVGEEIAARFGGISNDDIPRLLGRIKELQASIAKFESQAANSNAQSPRRSSALRQIDELKQEIKRYEALIAVAESRQVDTKLAAQSSPSPRVDQTSLLAEAAAARAAEEAARAAAEAAAAHAKEIQALVTSLQEQAAQLGFTSAELRQYQLDTSGATGQQRELAQAALDTITAFEESEARRQQALKDLDDSINREEEQQQRFKSVFEGLRTEEEAIRESYDRRLEIIRQNTVAGSALQEDLARRLIEQTDEQLKGLQEGVDELSEFGRAAAESMQSAFADFLFDPFDKGVKGMLEGFIQVINRMVAELLAQKALEALFGGASGDSTGGLIGGFLSAFGGKRAMGGPVSPGMTYLVGERGPELFSPPGAGQITPSGQFGGVNVSQVINVQGRVDQRTASQIQIEAARRQRVSMSRIG